MRGAEIMAQKANMTNTKQWYPAIYARLSKEDLDSGKSVSLSIEHQIDLLKDYVKSQGWQTPKVFYDDDRTGTNFNRKGFQDMYAEAKKGNINIIVVKDTSRFGRNWVQSGVYFENIEEMGIRFISIQENLDTADPQCPALKMLPFYFIFNEWHSQTTSEKIKTVLKKQAEQGKYLGSMASYGYDKDPEDKYKLLVDPYAAEIVKRIFELRLQKLSYSAIAKILNDDDILPPSTYFAQNRGVENKRTRINKWACNSVSNILNNIIYCGDVANNRCGNASYKKHRRVSKPVEEWIVTRDAHEAIISREDWQKCQELRTIGRIRSTATVGVATFAKLLKCPDCGYNLSRKILYYTTKAGEKKTRYGYNCNTRRRKGEMACALHYIAEPDLSAVVVADIREKAKAVLQNESTARERFYAIKAKSSGTQLNHDRKELKKVTKRLADLDNLIQAAFEKSVLGGGSMDMFTTLSKKYEAEKHELAKQANDLSTSIDKQSQTVNDVDTFISLMKKYVNITELDRATAVELIDHITVSASTVTPREIVIHYNLVGNVE